MKAKRFLITLLAGIFVLSGCSDNSGDSSSVSKTSNNSDVSSSIPTSSSSTSISSTTISSSPSISSVDELINNTEIQYIGNRTVDYDSANECHRIFWGFQNAAEEYIAADEGTISLRIENDAGQIVYDKTININKSNFTTWTNSYWDSARLLGCYYLKDEDIEKGSSAKGSLYFMATLKDGTFFDEYKMNISDLPIKGLEIILPEIGKEYIDYEYSDEIDMITRIDSLSYTYDIHYDNTVTATFKMKSTMTYNSEPGISKMHHISYKLRDSEGIIVDSGSFYITQADMGNTVLTEEYISNLSLDEVYTLEFTNTR